MPFQRYDALVGRLILFGLAAISVLAQDWTPSKIVAITDYPRVPKLARIQGTVEVKCTLDSNGSVTAAEAISGPRQLQEPARQNALQWRFRRASKEGQYNSVILQYDFLLDGKRQDDSKTAFVFELPNRIQVVAPVEYIRGAP